jgi:hypothetical protein
MLHHGVVDKHEPDRFPFENAGKAIPVFSPNARAMEARGKLFAFVSHSHDLPGRPSPIPNVLALVNLCEVSRRIVLWPHRSAANARLNAYYPETGECSI